MDALPLDRADSAGNRTLTARRHETSLGPGVVRGGDLDAASQPPVHGWRRRICVFPWIATAR
jgi:hypothetical protein